MDALGKIDPLLVGCVAIAVLIFVAREVASGLLRAVGSDLWAWLKRRRIR